MLSRRFLVFWLVCFCYYDCLAFYFVVLLFLRRGYVSVDVVSCGRGGGCLEQQSRAIVPLNKGGEVSAETSRGFSSGFEVSFSEFLVLLAVSRCR